MSAVIKTTWVKPKQPKSKRSIDVNSLKIVDEVFDGKRKVSYRYDKIFNKMKIGQAVACKKEDAGSLSNAMRDYIKRMGKAAKVRCTQYDEDFSRVWMLEA